eukprot:scaffold45824_cov60-Phaeocystis_antarctica.AAC.3
MGPTSTCQTLPARWVRRTKKTLPAMPISDATVPAAAAMPSCCGSDDWSGMTAPAPRPNTAPGRSGSFTIPSTKRFASSSSLGGVVQRCLHPRGGERRKRREAASSM